MVIACQLKPACAGFDKCTGARKHAVDFQRGSCIYVQRTCLIDRYGTIDGHICRGVECATIQDEFACPGPQRTVFRHL